MMKEIYETPELELKKFIPEKEIAMQPNDGLDKEIHVSDSDVELPL